MYLEFSLVLFLSLLSVPKCLTSELFYLTYTLSSILVSATFSQAYSLFLSHRHFYLLFSPCSCRQD